MSHRAGPDGADLPGWTPQGQPAGGPRAQYEQAVAAYVNQVLIAYGDVEDALTDLHALTSRRSGVPGAAVRASADYRRLAEVQYTNGLVDYLTVIDAERTLLANQLALAQATRLTDERQHPSHQGARWRLAGSTMRSAHR